MCTYEQVIFKPSVWTKCDDVMLSFKANIQVQLNVETIEEANKKLKELSGNLNQLGYSTHHCGYELHGKYKVKE